MPHLYSQRMLNPYHGIVNVVEIDGADAVSSDGITWSLFIHGEPEFATLDDGSVRPVETADIRFGTWSQQEGLKRAPVRDAADYEFVDHIGCYLLDTIRVHLEEVPFPLEDRYELWLLDAAFELPLALLESVCTREEIRHDLPRQWRSGFTARGAFVPSEGVMRQLKGRNGAEVLERLVNAAAGSRPRAEWFLRRCGHQGISLAVNGRTLPPTAFPEQQLRSHWPDAFVQRLVRDYLDWQAPYLLMLQDLSDETRDRLEQAAGRRARLLAEKYPLFPKVIDEGRIIAARVESRMRQALGEEEEEMPPDEALNPFFNE